MTFADFLRDVFIAGLVILSAGFVLGCGTVAVTVWRESRRGRAQREAAFVARMQEEHPADDHWFGGTRG